MTLLAFAIFFVLVGVTALVFRAAGRERALALGLMVSQRNMGLMVAATDGLLPGTTWLYFALSANCRSICRRNCSSRSRRGCGPNGSNLPPQKPPMPEPRDACAKSRQASKNFQK